MNVKCLRSLDHQEEENVSNDSYAEDKGSYGQPTKHLQVDHEKWFPSRCTIGMFHNCIVHCRRIFWNTPRHHFLQKDARTLSLTRWLPISCPEMCADQTFPVRKLIKTGKMRRLRFMAAVCDHPFMNDANIDTSFFFIKSPCKHRKIGPSYSRKKCCEYGNHFIVSNLQF